MPAKAPEQAEREQLRHFVAGAFDMETRRVGLRVDFLSAEKQGRVQKGNDERMS